MSVEPATTTTTTLTFDLACPPPPPPPLHRQQHVGRLAHPVRRPSYGASTKLARADLLPRCPARLSYPLSNFTFTSVHLASLRLGSRGQPLTELDDLAYSQKEAQPEEDASVAARIQRLQSQYEQNGMRRTVEGIMLVHVRRPPPFPLPSLVEPDRRLLSF